MVQRDVIHDVDLSIRFKHGKNTIFLFVDPMATFSHLQEELFTILKERYADGITTTDSPKKTQLPNSASQIKFAVLKDKTDPAEGWKPLTFGLDDAPVDKGLQDNMTVAFAIAPDDADEAEEVSFEVDFPSYDEEVLEDGGES
ncbi:hypothetical protein F4801DRAFT_528593 [Xylaria longipes]|nr:hypothetical protein F4801DRAFT_528593 [Xylaria longipes]RYC56544.1 hypothetical protein CHU98_g9664 [Xylaria longipes]